MLRKRTISPRYRWWFIIDEYNKDTDDEYNKDAGDDDDAADDDDDAFVDDHDDDDEKGDDDDDDAIWLPLYSIHGSNQVSDQLHSTCRSFPQSSSSSS